MLDEGRTSTRSRSTAFPDPMAERNCSLLPVHRGASLTESTQAIVDGPQLIDAAMDPSGPFTKAHDHAALCKAVRILLDVDVSYSVTCAAWGLMRYPLADTYEILERYGSKV